MKDFTDSIGKLSLESCILIIGLLSQRALELMMAEKDSKTSKVPGIIKPEVKLV